ncbi:MAG: hypothetical protein ACXVJA_16775, partial [Acidimicrobiia bacterium]
MGVAEGVECVGFVVAVGEFSVQVDCALVAGEGLLVVAAKVKQSIKDLPGDQKPVVGQAVSQYTAAVTEAIDRRLAEVAGVAADE